MATINTAASGHGNRTEVYSGGTTIQYNTYPNVTTVEKNRLTRITRAVDIINKLDAKIDLNGPCNKYFKTLPRGKNFSHFWRDPAIFIDFSPSTLNGFYGATHSSNKDVAVTAWCLDSCNHWMIAATLVHEFAHVAGAPGGSSHAAEKAADMCGFKPQYNPSIIGSIKQLGAYLESLA